MFLLTFLSSNTRRRISLQALLHAATFTRRMEKIYKKMDPLKPSPSEEALLQKLQGTSLMFSKVDQTPGITSSKRWRKIKEKKAESGAEVILVLMSCTNQREKSRIC